MADKLPITLKKEDDVLSFLIALFSILDSEAHPKEITTDGNNINIREKEDSEITRLNVDVAALKSKVFGWFDDRFSMWLSFDEKESNDLRECIHAAYYFVTEKEKSDKGYERFIAYYNELKKYDAL
jgi:hypothetical protein